jgi:hypothetical protein
MSRINGDKSRYNRVRKQNIDRRKRGRELWKSLQQPLKPAAAAAAPKAEPVSA